LARWRLLEPDADMVSELAREADVDLLCARVLANRGVAPGAASDFLSPSLAAIGMPDEDQWNVAAARVAKAIEDGERIGVFGDYDTDGITSAAVLFSALSHYTDNITVGLPTRQTGYGLLEPYVRDLFAEGVDLLITADCGISNRSEVALANELGMEVIVTDHHIPPEDPPDTAVAVLDPKLWDPEDPLAGVGVAWKFAWAVVRGLGDAEGRKRLGRLLDLVSVGTVVDIAPLVGDNRALARMGPRINSIGRIKNPRPALDLLLTDDRREAFRIASLLNQLNAERQRRTRFAVERAMAEVDPEQDFKVVVTEETGGLAGLIAGRVAGATGRPAAILTRRADDSYGGSARAGDTDVDLYGALYTVRQLMREWGGHRRAAGLSVKPGNLDAFVAGVNEAVRAQSIEKPEIFVPAIEVDAEIPLGSVSNGLLDWHEKLAPFGSGNNRPIFSTESLRISGSRKIWEGMNLLDLGGGIKAKMAGEPDGLPSGPFDAAYTVTRSRYSGQAELEIVDWKEGQ
jgi:single-stranded-DNA-specific exonuclease